VSDEPRSEQEQEEERNWLERPSTIRKLWIAFSIVLALTVFAQFFLHLHEYFRVDDEFGFYAAYGFLSCVAMVVVAKLLGLVLKKPGDFYDDH
jgi:hypothetical protein